MPSSIRSTRALLAAFAALSGFLSFSNAQTSVSTTPVGAVTTNIAVGVNSVGLTLVNPDLVTASVSSNTTSAITVSGVTNVGALLTSGLPYYVEVVSGTMEGERFDVDTAATITSANGTITITSSPNNTMALTAGALASNQIALRKHVTLAQVQSLASTTLVGNNTANSADQIQLFNSATNSFTAYYLRGDGVTWRQVGSLTSANNVVIAPGTGFLFKKLTAATSLVSVGSVRTNDFAMPLSTGLAFRALPYPTAYSPTALNATTAGGWTGNNTASAADQLQVWNPATNSFTTYYLRADGTSWRAIGSLTNVAANNLFAADAGVLVSRKTADANYGLGVPFSL